MIPVTPTTSRGFESENVAFHEHAASHEPNQNGMPIKFHQITKSIPLSKLPLPRADAIDAQARTQARSVEIAPQRLMRRIGYAMISRTRDFGALGLAEGGNTADSSKTQTTPARSGVRQFARRLRLGKEEGDENGEL